MRTSRLDYDLPEELIAQSPASPRDSSRLMVVDAASGEISHHHFRDLPRFLDSGDALVLNETRVIPARLEARRPGGGRVELLFLRDLGAERADDDSWEVMARPGKRLRVGMSLSAGEETLEVARDLGDGRWRVRGRDVAGLLEARGEMPLPPYIHSEESEESHRESYQTVYAANPGSAAAPTAGLHFTSSLLGEVEASGVRVARVTLHVGAGTFTPVRSEDLRDHRMHAEWYRVPEEAARAVDGAERVIAVGTTVARTLESRAASGAEEGESELFIYPGYTWRAIDALITNFHLPRSTLLAMVMSFGGEDLIRRAYDVAVRERYRFYSFGDAMMVLNGGRTPGHRTPGHRAPGRHR